MDILSEEARSEIFLRGEGGLVRGVIENGLNELQYELFLRGDTPFLETLWVLPDERIGYHNRNGILIFFKSVCHYLNQLAAFRNRKVSHLDRIWFQFPFSMDLIKLIQSYYENKKKKITFYRKVEVCFKMNSWLRIYIWVSGLDYAVICIGISLHANQFNYDMFNNMVDSDRRGLTVKRNESHLLVLWEEERDCEVSIWIRGLDDHHEREQLGPDVWRSEWQHEIKRSCHHILHKAVCRVGNCQCKEPQQSITRKRNRSLYG